MDAHSLKRQFRYVVSLASLAYIFSGIHAIQYSQLGYDSMDDNDSHDHHLEPASTSYSDFTSTHDTSTPADNSSISGKASGRWTEQEISLLLDYVEAHCPLESPSGLNLKKTHFKKARDTVKTKDASQCHYKWGRVRFFLFINDGLFH